MKESGPKKQTTLNCITAKKVHSTCEFEEQLASQVMTTEREEKKSRSIVVLVGVLLVLFKTHRQAINPLFYERKTSLESR